MLSTLLRQLGGRVMTTNSSPRALQEPCCPNEMSRRKTAPPATARCVVDRPAGHCCGSFLAEFNRPKPRATPGGGARGTGAARSIEDGLHPSTAKMGRGKGDGKLEYCFHGLAIDGSGLRWGYAVAGEAVRGNRGNGSRQR